MKAIWIFGGNLILRICPKSQNPQAIIWVVSLIFGSFRVVFSSFWFVSYIIITKKKKRKI